MSIVYINIGFPGSGKSTYSRKSAQENENTVIINRYGKRSAENRRKKKEFVC